MRTTVNVTFGALLYSGLFRGIQLPGTPGGPKRQLTILHNSIPHGGVKVTVRLVRHGSYAVSAPASVLEAWNVIEPKLERPLSEPTDGGRLFVRSILNDSGCCRDIVDTVLRMGREERSDFVERAALAPELAPEDRVLLKRLVQHSVATASAFECIEKARGGSSRRAAQ